MHADCTYPCTPQLPPHKTEHQYLLSIQPNTNIHSVLNPPIFTLQCHFRACTCTLLPFNPPLKKRMLATNCTNHFNYKPLPPHDPPCYCVRPQLTVHSCHCKSSSRSTHTHRCTHAQKTLGGAIYKWAALLASNWGNQHISMSQLPTPCQGSSSPPILQLHAPAPALCNIGYCRAGHDSEFLSTLVGGQLVHLQIHSSGLGEHQHAQAGNLI